MSRTTMSNWMPLLVAAVLVTAPTCASAVASPESDATPGGAPTRVIQVRIPAPSMRGNLLGQPGEMPIAVCLPPGYATSSRRYPVVYFLPGFGDRVRDFVQNRYGFALPDSMDRCLASGETRECILVVVNGFNSLGGSFYANSPVTGKWEEWVTRDVVSYVDATYRTLPAARSRGLAGHSMGGAGALRIAMLHPGVFGAVYAMSPGLFAKDGLAETVLLSDSVAAWVLREDSLLAATPAPRQMERLDADLAAADWTRYFTCAYGAAFAPEPSARPPHMRYPVRVTGGERVLDRRLARRWEEGFGDLPRKVREHAGDLRRLGAIGIEYGNQDELPWIPEGCRYLSQLLDAQHVRHSLILFEGAHDDHLGERLMHAMLPFFSRSLEFERDQAPGR
jgi:S-formylglutathione hydrolase